MLSLKSNEQNLKNLLTPRELEVLQLVCEDLSYQEIAERLQLSKRTVGFHVGNALHKTKCRSIIGLVVAFVKQETESSILK